MTDTTAAPKYKTGPTVRVPNDARPLPATPPPPSPPQQVTLPERPSPWRAMDSLPKEPQERVKLGYIYLGGDPYNGPHEEEREYYWYRTRQFRKGSFQETGWWRRRFGPNTPPGFTPIGWRLVSEGYPADGAL